MLSSVLMIALMVSWPTVSLAQDTDNGENDSTPIESEPAAESGSRVGELLKLTLESCQIDPSHLQEETQQELINQGKLITEQTISQMGLTTPSLWWAQTQFGRDKLLQNWLAYPEQKRIDLIVNRQLWGQMDYLAQYSFVNKFGTIAREYDYELRVFNRQPQCLAVYWCNTETPNSRCEIDLQPPRRDPFNIF
ncbi:hypothetical protein PN462_17105 [Spirulina sp. CS-785/01]|uniref:hypothetical protein n=1 Tax=Spirulina sp. CS-785/01 TaxID=3021716 RepID=UPI00232DAE38|nr:hypothetical protein [Spirulina sp. CS-785/01]MDB9314835.1 hypothetical protein [Spirulina sp. CS-785/01]